MLSEDQTESVSRLMLVLVLCGVVTGVFLCFALMALCYRYSRLVLQDGRRLSKISTSSISWLAGWWGGIARGHQCSHLIILIYLYHIFSRTVKTNFFIIQNPKIQVLKQFTFFIVRRVIYWSYIDNIHTSNVKNTK